MQSDNGCRNMLSECSENHTDLISQETEDIISLTDLTSSYMTFIGQLQNKSNIIQANI